MSSRDVDDLGLLSSAPGRLEVHASGYGSAATELLATQIARIKAGDVLAPVTVVVASNYAGISIRRALAGRPGGLAAVSFTTLARVAETLAAPHLASSGRRPVAGPVLAQAVRQVLGTDPGRFSPVAAHPATETALVSAHRELSGSSPHALAALSGAGPLTEDVVRVSTQVRSALAAGWYDEQDLLLTAARLVEAGGANGEAVIVHQLQSISWAESQLLLALAGRRRVTVNVGLTGDGHADAAVLEAHRRAGIEVASPSIQRPVCSAILSVSDPDEEVRAALRLVVDWIRQGVPLGRIAVLYATADPYARLLHEQLDAAGITRCGAPVRAVGEMFLGRTVRALLGLPDRDFRRSDVLALMTGAGLLDGDRPAPVRAWQRISREAGVVCGADWSVRLAAFASRQRLRAEQAEREGAEPRAAHLRRDAERAEELAAFVGRLRADVESVAAAGTWHDMAALLVEALGRWVGHDRRRWSWPTDEVRAAERVEEAIERLASLDELGGGPPTVEVFRRALDVDLELALGRVGRLGRGVLTAPVGTAVGVETDRTVVLGMAEGTFPPRRAEDSLLPDECREQTGGEIGLRGDRHGDDHRQLLAVMACTAETVLVYPRGDLRRSGERPASRWLLHDAAVLAGAGGLFSDDLARLSAPWLKTVPSYAAGVASTLFPATEQDFRLAAMLHDQDAVISRDPVLRSGMELARARRSGAFTRFDGNLAHTDLGGADLPDYTAGAVTSATRLQDWVKCPHAFFMNHLLGVEVGDEPEKRLEMSPLDKGQLVHAILDEFIAEQVSSGGRGPWSGQAAARLDQIAEEMFTRFELQGLTGRGAFWRHDRERLRRDLVRFAAEDRGQPIGTETRFDRAVYRLPDSREVLFRGSIDRVDRLDGDRRMVLDYKTGSTVSYRGLTAGDPHQGGSHLQLAVYAAASRRGDWEDVEAYYWFVTAKGDFVRVGYPVTREVHDSVGAAIATVVDGIRAGVFPRRPSAAPAYHYVDCWYCSPDGQSSADARREWERKRTAPQLDSYLRLVEPDALRDDV